MDKKNIIIIVLIVLLGLCFLWGAWGNQYHKIYRANLHDAKEKIVALELYPQKVETITVRATELQEVVQIQEQQLGKLEEELAEKDALLAELKKSSEVYTAGLQKQLTEMERVLLEKKQLLVQRHKKYKEAILQAAADKKKHIAAIEKAQLNRHYEAATTKDIKMLKAQIIGLEKIVKKRDNIVEKLSNSLDIIKINREVLLEKISDQNDALQKLREDNRALIRKLTDKNKQIADLQEQLQMSKLRIDN